VPVLSGREIRERLLCTEGPRRLYVTPLLDAEEQLDAAAGAIDVRLGTTFIVGQRSGLTAIDPLRLGAPGVPEAPHDAAFQRSYDSTYVPVGQPFVLHPHQYVLGATLEYVKLPEDLTAQVVGRSSWGRLGLIIATATIVHPRFAGVITLELANVGEVPLVICPGVRIGQLLFEPVRAETEAEALPSGRYSLTTEPTISRLPRDPEFSLLRRISQPDWPPP